MSARQLLLCTDMDRTVIPNGHQPEHPAARDLFRAFCRQPGISLVYVTGRDQMLAQEAISQFALPDPGYAVTDVGSRMYRVSGQEWRYIDAWDREIAGSWQGRSHADLEAALRPVSGPVLQEREKQNRFKLSYYLPLEAERDGVMREIRERLTALGVAAALVWSVDEPRRVGLLDILPENATKLHALQFLHQQLGFVEDEVLFAGDSGNDLPVLASTIRSVLVANASDEVRNAARQLARHSGRQEQLYCARQDGFAFGGHYAAGVLQGIWHFCPQFRPALQQLGFSL